MAQAENTKDVEARARAGLASFRSSGLHVLEAYISPSPSTAAPPSAPSAPEQASTSGRSRAQHPDRSLHNHAAPTAELTDPRGGQLPPGPSRVWTGGIPADNVGFRLLRKAGWSVGTGLGAGEQGRREPIEAALPKGTRGLGFDSRAAQQQQQQQQHRQGRKRDAAEAGVGAGAGEGEGEASRRREGQQPGAGVARRRGGSAAERMTKLVEAELARESLGDKVARHRAVESAEQERARGRAIERYLRSAFNDPFDHLRSDNSNPLARRHKLTESNPLLDPLGD